MRREKTLAETARTAFSFIMLTTGRLMCLFLGLFLAAAAAAAKSLQLCPTLCDPIDDSPPGSPVPGIFQARTLEWGAISFSSSVTKSCLILLCLQGLQHARLPCPSLPPRVCSNSCPLSRWCCPTILSSVAPFSSFFQSFPTSGSFPMSQLFASHDQNIRASSSVSVLPKNIQGWFPLGLIGLIFLLSKGLSRVFSCTTVWKHQFFITQPSSANFHICT